MNSKVEPHLLPQLGWHVSAHSSHALCHLLDPHILACCIQEDNMSHLELNKDMELNFYKLMIIRPAGVVRKLPSRQLLPQ